MTPDKRVEEVVDGMRYTTWTPVGGVSNMKWYSREDVVKAFTQHHQDMMSEVVERIKQIPTDYVSEAQECVRDYRGEVLKIIKSHS